MNRLRGGGREGERKGKDLGRGKGEGEPVVILFINLFRPFEMGAQSVACSCQHQVNTACFQLLLKLFISFYLSKKPFTRF